MLPEPIESKSSSDRTSFHQPCQEITRISVRIAKIYGKTANQRRDFLQKTTTEISQKYAHICIEDLSVTSPFMDTNNGVQLGSLWTDDKLFVERKISLTDAPYSVNFKKFSGVT